MALLPAHQRCETARQLRSASDVDVSSIWFGPDLVDRRAEPPENVGRRLMIGSMGAIKSNPKGREVQSVAERIDQELLIVALQRMGRHQCAALRRGAEWAFGKKPLLNS